MILLHNHPSGAAESSQTGHRNHPGVKPGLELAG
ncbi:hypothetical protein [Pinirhizobacter soli]